MKSSTNPLPIRLVTHNIRYATSTPFRGEEPWPKRRPRLISELHFHTAHISAAIICLQEVLHSQLLDILSGLNASSHSQTPNPNSSDQPEWASVGVGRDDGICAGEYSPLLYRPSVWRLRSHRTLWLSETPQIPGSKSWDAALPRILTIGIFQHRESKRSVVAMNTHLDDRGVRSREEAARMIVREVEGYATGMEGREGMEGMEGMGVLLAGDFNSEVEGGAYQVINSTTSPMTDLRELVPEAERYGHENTFTGFGFEEEKRPKRIDFLFVNNGDGNCKQTLREAAGGADGSKGTVSHAERTPWRVNGYAVLANRFEDGVYNSDHRAVVGDVVLI